MRSYSVQPLAKLAEYFEKLPGIGRKTAYRLAYALLDMDKETVENFAKCMINVKQNVSYCAKCCNFAEKELCPICSDKARDRSIICVVEEPKDVQAFEKSGEYNALYHVLHGSISPLNGIGPDQLRMKELINRVSSSEVKEIIMATNPTVEGEATSMYISKLLKPMHVKVTRIAYGVPFGCALEYTDEETLSMAINGRIEI